MLMIGCVMEVALWFSGVLIGFQFYNMFCKFGMRICFLQRLDCKDLTSLYTTDPECLVCQWLSYHSDTPY